MSFWNFKNCVFFIIWQFLSILTIFGKFRQFWDSFKDTSRWFWPTYFFSVSFPCWVKVRMIILREKVHIFPTFSVAQIGGSSTRKSNLLPSSQAALARVQNVRSGHGIRQNIRKICTFLMVPCWVWYDHYRGRYRQLKKVSIYRADPVHMWGWGRVA